MLPLQSVRPNAPAGKNMEAENPSIESTLGCPSVRGTPGIGRERLDIPPLPFGIDRVESQRRLARPTQPRDDDELVARDRDIDVLEIVLARPFDDDRAWHRSGLYHEGSV